MKPLFNNPQLQKEFEENGFVKISLLNKEQVDMLTQAYSTVSDAHERIGLPYITTSHSNDADLITKVDNILQAVIAPAVDQYLSDYRLLFGNFLVKMPGENSATDPHQDITFVDESIYTSVNIWVALEDVSVKNGCMYFLKGSHNLLPTIRPTHDYPWAYENVKGEIKKASTVYEAKAGDAFIFNHAVVHGSFENTSNTPRLAAVLAAYNADAPLIHYYLPDVHGDQLQKYGMHKEAYLHFIKGQPPVKGIYLGEKKFSFNTLTRDEFNTLWKKKQRGNILPEWLDNLFIKMKG